MLPYQMFMLLADPSTRMVESLLSLPPCFRDELSQKLMDRFGSDLNGAEAIAILEALASIIAVDVASIEAGHSSAREFANLRSRGWTSSLETVSSRFLLLQRKTLGATTSQRMSSKVKPTKKDGQKKRRGGGGAWRAFVHQNAKGMKLTAQLAASLSAAYHDLSDADWQRYSEAGQAGTAVHRMSMRAFPAHPRPGPRQGRNAAVGMLLDGDRTRDGVIVAADAPDGAIQSFAREGTLTDRYVSYQAELAALFKARVDALDLSKDEVVALARHQEDAPCLAAAQQWERDGHSELAAAVSKVPAAASTTAAFSWNPHVEKPVQDLLSNENVDVRRQFGLNALLQSRWSERCRIHFHADQAPIKPMTGAFRPSRCLVLGFCFCGESRMSCPDAMHFAMKLRPFLQSTFHKTSEARRQLEQQSVVLQFRVIHDPLDEVSTTVEHFAHIGHMNLSTYHYSLLRLHANLELLGLPPDLSDDTGVLQAGHLSPECAEQAMGVYTDLQFYRDVLDLSLPWHVAVFTISDQENHWHHLDSSSSTVPLVPFPGLDPSCVWIGSEKESEARRRSQEEAQKRAQKKAGLAGQGAGDRKRKRTGVEGGRRRGAPGFEENENAAAGEAGDAAAPGNHLPQASAGPDGASKADDKELEALFEMFEDPYLEQRKDAVSEFFNVDNPDLEEDAAVQSLADAVHQGDIPGNDSDIDTDASEWSLDPLLADFEDAQGLGDDGDDETAAVRGEQVETALLAPVAGRHGSAADLDDVPQALPVPSGLSGSAGVMIGEAAEPSAPSAAPRALQPARQLEKLEFSLGSAGKLRYVPANKVLFAICPLHPDCKMERTCRGRGRPEGGFAGQGRPLGLLCQWLFSHAEFDDQQSHLRKFRHTHASREEARSQFLSLEGAAQFSATAERPQREGEESECYMIFFRKDKFTLEHVKGFKKLLEDIATWIRDNHEPRSLTSFLLEESSPIFQEHWENLQKQKKHEMPVAQAG
ncbi:unnamed protein product [Symbiodinium sp. CCMP2456]|nr:unnamed protein product [Symbiodinium sp. CCMP2456]